MPDQEETPNFKDPAAEAASKAFGEHFDAVNAAGVEADELAAAGDFEGATPQTPPPTHPPATSPPTTYTTHPPMDGPPEGVNQ